MKQITKEQVLAFFERVLTQADTNPDDIVPISQAFEQDKRLVKIGVDHISATGGLLKLIDPTSLATRQQQDEFLVEGALVVGISLGRLFESEQVAGSFQQIDGILEQIEKQVQGIVNDLEAEESAGATGITRQRRSF